MKSDTSPTPSTRDALWEWAVENLPTLREMAQHQSRTEQPTSVVNSFLGRLFRQPTKSLLAIRDRTAYAARGIRNIVAGRVRRRGFVSIDASELPIPEHMPDGQDADDRRQVFRQAWEQLSVDERLIVETQEIRGLTSEQIGATLGISGDAVRKRKQTITDKLRIGVALLAAALANRWHPGTIHYRLISLRHFRGLSVDSIAKETGWSRRRVERLLNRTRTQLPADLKGCL